MYKAIYFDMDGTIADLYGVDGWLDWSLWGDYDACLKEACSIFASNVF